MMVEELENKHGATLREELQRSREELDTTVGGLEGWAASLREVLAKAEGGEPES